MALLPYLGLTLRQEREAQTPRVTRENIASAVGCSLDKVRNLENGKAWPRRPGDADDLVLAYAKLTDSAPRTMWEDALARWRADDEAPDPTLASRAASADAAARRKRRRAG